LFEEQVERTPDTVALVFEDERLTYRELNIRANQVAHHLQSLGVGPEVLVAICVERSPDMVAGLLGILKAGGAYLPLDPNYPQERLAFMLEDAQVSVLLTTSRQRDVLPDHTARVVCLDTDRAEIALQGDTRPDGIVSALNLAYVLFTSGSTGRPKGVAIEHRSASAMLHWARQTFSQDLSGMLASTSLSFDLSVFELFGALSWGGCVFLAQNALQLPTLPAAHQVTLVNTVPSAITQLLRSGDIPPSVRTVNLAGEPLLAHVVDQLYAYPSVQRVFDLYGPSEDTTYSTFALRQAGGVETIGRPIHNTQVYLLDENLQPVPIGVPGELYVGGDGLARGYLNRPGLTADKFIPNPFTLPAEGEEGTRLYKTGDLARYLPDGNIEFIGRVDHQVKIRGFRIELGEIETALRQHPALKEVVVLAREDMPGRDKQLVAYIVPEEEASAPSVSELRAFLKQGLPDYMLPSAFVTLEALPLTPNGKVDRRALPAPEQVRPALDETFVAPRTHVEEELARVWGDVLRLEGIGVHDDFFELGGQSLLATQALSRLNKIFDTELSLVSFFEHPTIARLAQEIARQEQTAQPGIPLEPVAKGGVLPLSFAQQRLWFMDQLVPHSPLYNIPALLRIEGTLDVAVLRRCLDEIVRRHEALRTTFADHGHEPVQVISAPYPVKLEVHDLRALPQAERESQAQHLMHARAQQPFDLTQPSLLRATLVQHKDQAYQLLLTIHHIAADGWSLSVIVDELQALYCAFAEGRPSPLPELPLQYADFAGWQQRYVRSEAMTPHLDYWKAQFDGRLPVLDLPTDRPRPATQTYRGAKQSLPLPPALVETLEAFSRQENATLFMTMLAAFQTLLHRYSGQSDIVVGTAIANRNRAEIENLVGFFVNTLPLRCDLSGNPTFRELIGQVRQTTLGAFAHQDLPLETLIQELALQRDPSHNPLFQVMFVVQNMPVHAVQLPQASVSFTSELDTGTSKFDLIVFIEFPRERPTAIIEYNTDLFDTATINRMLGHYQTLLEGIVADPDQRLAQLPLLTQAERHQLLHDWNDTRSAYPRHACVHELFEAQAARTPDAVAVVFETERLTYRELDQRANQLAHYLQKLGVGPETLVGLCVERSLDLVVGLLGVLKAGGAYVPLEPDYPEERLRFMLADTGVNILLTQQKLLPRFSGQDVSAICLDSQWETIVQHSPENLPHTTTPDNLAYVMYTSGSTGRPKGSSIPHRGIVRLVQETNYARLGAEEVFLQIAPISFDAATLEVWAPLLNGGRLVIMPPHQPSLAELGQAIRQHQITTLWLTAGLFHLMVEEQLDDLLSPHQVMSGGDVLSVAHVQTVLQHAPQGLTFTNAYGPTENTTFTTCHPMTTPRTFAKSVPIGRPIANTQIYILDAHIQPVPIGIPGEMYIGGAGLARDYLNRPALTATSFVPNPFGEPGSRLYKTGDLARYLPDGNVEFLGRMDNQVKLRGFRIELGEIEVMLAQHPDVREAVAIVRQDDRQDKQLVAYVIGEVKSAQLRGYLEEKLPDYMIPSAFVRVETFPLTPNGKIDRRALPAPPRERPALDQSFAAPRSATEKELLAIWEKVLQLQGLGIYDNFFQLGGHSLLATQVTSYVRDVFQINLPLRTFFQGPTIAELAQNVEAAQGTRLKEPALMPRSRSAHRVKRATLKRN
jgi:amino acid adenylation domain-containing protein